MQEQINQLQKQVKELQDALTFSGMSFDTREIIRNEVIDNEDTITVRTASITVPAGGSTFNVPAAYTGFLILKWRGKQYKVPYV